MRPLTLKLIRDLGHMKGQTVAVALVTACGLMVMIMSRGLIVSLETARDGYYAENRFADVFCEVKRAPNAMRPRLAEIAGVAALDTRIKGNLFLDLPGMEEPVDGIAISLPNDRPQQLHRLFLRTGRLPERGRHNETVISEAFAKAHGYQPGDTVDVTIQGARERLRIVGIGLSPEFIFEARPGTAIPDSYRFGVFWMNEDEMAKAYNLGGAFNSVLAKLAPGADLRGVKADLDRLLAPYGGLVAYDRTEQYSAKVISDRITVLNGFSIVFPIIFLGVAAFMSSAALTRLVRLQREQIAQLKAFGYSRGAIGLHYFQFALVFVLLATLVGGVCGMWLGTWIVTIYAKFFQFPALPFRPDWFAILWALLASAATSFAGVLGAVRQAMNLPPAEAMRPEPPADFKPSRLERLGVQRLLTPAFRMALRNLERKPWQAFFTTVGLALATAIPILPGAMRDGTDYLMDFQWRFAQRQDATLTLVEAASSATLNDMRRMPGVFETEAFRSVASRLCFGHCSRRIAITGLPAGARLNLLLDAQGKKVALPPSGILVSEKLAEVLGARPGDSVRIEVQEGRRPVLETVIAGTITDFTGLSAYMELGALRRLLREDDTISGAYLAVDRTHWTNFLARAKEMPRIASIVRTQAARESFESNMGSMIDIMRTIYFTFGVIVSFGVVYNGARIALSERARDLATLRVLGFTRREVASILIGELALLTLIALPPGLCIGYQFATLLISTASTETIRMPVVVTRGAYATAALIVLVSSCFSFWVVSQRIRNLDLLGVLKAHE